MNDPACLPFPTRGLYALTGPIARFEDFEAAVIATVKGGAKVLQYRDKSNDTKRREREAKCISRICRRAKLPFIVNDDVELALACQADGIHLGRDDANCEMVRRQVGHTMLIGVSCYADVERAQLAQASGATYVAFGRFFPSATKPLAPPCPLAVLTKAKAQLRIPIVAIGGITPENGSDLLAAGADMLAVTESVFRQSDPAAAAARYQHLFNY